MKHFFRVNLIFVVILFILIGVVNCNKSSESPVKIKIGAIMPLTGPAAWLGDQHKWGLEIALEEINSRGGIDGEKLEIIYEDDQGDPKTAVSAFNLLIIKHNPQIVFVVMSSSALAIQPIADNKKVVLFANVGHPKIAEISEWTFRNFITSQQEASFMAKFCFQQLNLRSLAVLYVNDAYGESGFNVFKKVYSESGGIIRINEKYNREGSDFRTEITKVINMKPEAIYIIGYGKPVANLLNQLKELKYEGTILGTNNFSGPPVNEIALTALESAIFTAPKFYSGAKNEKMKKFILKVKERFKNIPQWNTAVEYDAMHMISQALQTATSKSASDIKYALEKTTSFKGLAGKYQYLKNGEWALDLSVRTYSNKAQVPYHY